MKSFFILAATFTSLVHSARADLPDPQRLTQALIANQEIFQEFSRHGNTIVEINVLHPEATRVRYYLRIAQCQKEGCLVGGAILSIEETEDQTVFPPYRYQARLGLIP